MVSVLALAAFTSLWGFSLTRGFFLVCVCVNPGGILGQRLLWPVRFSTPGGFAMYGFSYGMDHWDLVWADLNGLFPFDIRDFDADLCWSYQD